MHGSLHAHSHTYTETHTHTQVQGMAPFASAHSAMQSNSCAPRAHSFATADVAAIAACNNHNNNKCNNNHSGKSAAKDMQLSAWRFRNVWPPRLAPPIFRHNFLIQFCSFAFLLSFAHFGIFPFISLFAGRTPANLHTICCCCCCSFFVHIHLAGEIVRNHKRLISVVMQWHCANFASRLKVCNVARKNANAPALEGSVLGRNMVSASSCTSASNK